MIGVFEVFGVLVCALMLFVGGVMIGYDAGAISTTKGNYHCVKAIEEWECGFYETK